METIKTNKRDKETYNSFKELNIKQYKDLYQSTQEYEKDPYSKQQNDLYKQTLYGLKNYTEAEIAQMGINKRKSIEILNHKAQKELNILKQKKIIDMTNKILGLFNKDKTLANVIINNYSDPNPHFFCTMSLKELKISKEDIVNTFITKRILPENFKSL
jgi:hypothetical protein